MVARVHCERMADTKHICMQTGDRKKPVCDRQDCPGAAEQRKTQEFLKQVSESARRSTTHTFTDAELAAHNATIRSAALAEAVKEIENAIADYDAKIANPAPFPSENIPHWEGRKAALGVVSSRITSLAPTPPGMVCVELEKLKHMASQKLPHEMDDDEHASCDFVDGWIAMVTLARAMLAAYGGKE